MQITKEKITTIAMSHVEPMKDYDKDEIIAKTAIDLADMFHEEFIKEMQTEDVATLRRIFKRIAGNTIDWIRLNRKAHPDEYADGAWRMTEEIAQMGANL